MDSSFFKLIEKINLVAENTDFNKESKLFKDCGEDSFKLMIKLNGRVPYYIWLASCIKILQPKIVLELGRERGRSTLSLNYFLPDDSIFISVDLREECIDVPIELKKQKNRFFLTADSSSELAKEKIKEIIGTQKIDFIFIDTDHTETQLLKELSLFLPLMEENGLVALDDIFLNSGMKRVWDSFNFPKKELNELHPESGFGVFMYKKALKNDV